MEAEEEQEASKSSSENLGMVSHDHGGSGPSRDNLAVFQPITLGDQHSIPFSSTSLQHVGIDTAAPGEPTWRMRRLARMKAKGRYIAPERNNGPLNLLDLPVDVVKEILSQVTSTSDLTSLALTHSALHHLVIPIIYSRFSIVWPTDEGPPDSDTVDALTYGLATLVMDEDLFDKKQPYQKIAGRGYCQHCTCENCRKVTLRSGKHPIKTVRRGNQYAQYTRSFSIGNGPQENVKEYHIKREGGKMLGTLAAISLARMRNLETFKWDMPTGIVRDIWAALSCASTQLETVWVRFHDNRLSGLEPRSSLALPITEVPLSAPGAITQISPMLPGSGPDEIGDASLKFSYGRIEHPCFSILPPLKSLSVLDIDELAYADEMGVLIGRSTDTLRELRISVAPHFLKPGSWTMPANVEAFFDGVDITHLIFSKVNHSSLEYEPRKVPRHSPAMRAGNLMGLQGLLRSVNSLSHFAGASRSPAGPECLTLSGQTQPSINTEPTASAIPCSEPSKPKTLGLRILEIEGLLLNSTALQNSIDWSLITTLTLLHCGNHEQLWKGLRRAYSPRLPSGSTVSASPVFRREFSQVSSDEAKEILSHSNLHSFISNSSQETYSNYKLNLKTIHTDTVTPALIAFLKETLAPNSLEGMFLQDGRDFSSTVKLEAIFQGPMRRHRGSLTKVMIDSAIGIAGKSTNQQRKKWMFNTELLAFVTSGKMNSLQELAISLDYKDWHFFLRRLPRIPHLRSLYVPYIAHHDYSKHLKIGDLASQIVDLVSIRPEVQLCYLGIEDSCFQLIENRPESQFTRSTLYDLDTMDIDDTSEFNESENEENEDEDPADDDVSAAPTSDETIEANSDDDQEGAEDTDEDGSEVGKEEPAIAIRQILFYDSGVSVFNARHGEIRP